MTYSDLTELFLIAFHDTIRKMYKENKRKMRIVWEDCGMPKTLLVKYLKTGYPLMLSYRFFANIRKELENPENLHKKYRKKEKTSPRGACERKYRDDIIISKYY